MKPTSRTVATFLSLLAVLLVCGCKPAFSPTFHPAPGDLRKIEASENMTMKMQLMGQDVPTTITKRSVWTCEVLDVDAEGIIEIKLTYDAMDLDLGMDFAAMMPGGGPDLSFMTKGQDAIKGQSITARISPAGEVSSVEGVEDLRKKAQDAIEGTSGGLPKEAMEQFFEGAFSENAVRAQLDAWLAPYAQKEVKPQGSWTESGKDTVSAMTVPYEQTFTLTSIEGNVAKISFEKHFDSDSSTSTEVMPGMNVDFKPSGGATGTIEMEVDSGWITSIYAKINMTSKISMPGGMSMDMTMEGNSALTTDPK